VGVDEALARAREKVAAYKREQEEKEEALYEARGEDAQQAWETGRRYYQPILAAHSLSSREETPRGLQAETALQAIFAAGWHLHTWAVAGHSSVMGTIVFAYPLFVRGQ
jgi:hypothetical protein